MKEIILITNSFPYLLGEQFLDVEVAYYKNYQDVKFKIMPSRGAGQKRLIDDCVELDDYLIAYAESIKSYKLVFLLMKSIFGKVFYKEFFLYNLFSVNKLKSFTKSIVKYQLYHDAFDSYFKNKENEDELIVYTYWNTEITYALQSLKSKYGYRLVSRIHGADIYQERRPLEYMPLKRQFTENINKIYTITESANNYLHKTYGFDYSVLELSRLGVKDLSIVSKANKENILHIVSCSSLIEVKQVDKIIRALEVISKQRIGITYKWTHIGNGELYLVLKQMADEILGNLKNVHFEFKGHLDNDKVFEFYKNNRIDLFINSSKSEGVPVSIMEAMSCHIPIVAPNVGGISDMIIDGENGYLLSSVCEVDEIVGALNDVKFYKNKEIRNKSYILFLEKYDAKKNYEIFLDKITEKKIYDD